MRLMKLSAASGGKVCALGMLARAKSSCLKKSELQVRTSDVNSRKKRCPFPERGLRRNKAIDMQFPQKNLLDHKIEVLRHALQL